jgi:hypothetical protein
VPETVPPAVSLTNLFYPTAEITRLSVEEARMALSQTQKIRALNIAFWRNPVMNGRLMLSRYVADKGEDFAHKCLQALAGYDAWTTDNDPWNEADFCNFEIDGETVFAKLSYYDKHDQNYGSENAADPSKTLRIGVIMLKEEY